MKAIIFNGRFFRLSALVAAMLVSPILGGCLTAKNGKTLGIFSHMSTLYVLDERSEKPEDRRPSPFQVVIDNQTGVEIALESVANKGTSYDKPLYIPEDISGAVIQVRPEPAGGYSYRLEIELSASAENSKKVVYRRFSFDHHSDGYTLYSGGQIHHWVLTAEDFAVKPSRH